MTNTTNTKNHISITSHERPGYPARTRRSRVDNITGMTDGRLGELAAALADVAAASADAGARAELTTAVQTEIRNRAGERQWTSEDEEMAGVRDAEDDQWS